jgi:hypothetical protein
MQMNRNIIEAAISGFEQQKLRIDETIAELKAQLNGTSAPAKAAPSVATESQPKPERTMSAKAKNAIREAQKKRWAAFHAAQKSEKAPAKEVAVKTTETATKNTAPKRKMSPATRKKLAENLAKARAAKAEKAATA